MDIQLHLENGWKAFLQFIVPSLLVTVVLFVVAIVSLGILAPVLSAGYCQSLLRALREGRPPEVKDLFAYMSLFLPLFLFGTAVFLLLMLGFMLLMVPGVILSVFFTFACLYLLPLMTDRQQGIVDALKQSWQMATMEPVGSHVAITVIYLALVSVGGSIPFVILLAQPLAAFIMLSFYEERVKALPGATHGNPPPPPQ